MRRSAPALLILAILLAGCTFPGFSRPTESADGDPQDDFDGPGVLLVASNQGSYPITATWMLVDEHGTNRNSTSVVVQPGAEGQRKMPFPEVGPYTIVMQYNWTGDGRASSGIDRQPIHTDECPKLNRLAWNISASPNGQSGSSFANRACA